MPLNIMMEDKTLEEVEKLKTTNVIDVEDLSQGNLPPVIDKEAVDYKNILRGALLTMTFMLVDSAAFCTSFIKVDSNIFHGKDLLLAEVNKKFQLLSFFSFIITYGVSNILFNFFSGINVPIIASPIFEFRPKILDIANIVAKTVVEELKDDVYYEASEVASKISFMVYFILAICGFSVALLSFLIYSCDLTSYLKSIPTLAVYVVMANISISLSLEPFNCIQDMKIFENFSKYYYGLLGSSYAFAIILLLIEIFAPFDYLLLAFIAFYVGGFHIGDKFIFKFKEGGVAENVMSEKLSDISIFSFFSSLSLSKSLISFSIISACLQHICTGTIINLIQININVPAYSFATKTNVKLSYEYLVQAIANFGTAISGCPSAFQNSYSCILSSTNCTNKNSAYLAGALLIVLSFVLKYINHFIPILLGPVVLGYIGLSMGMSYLIYPLMNFSTTDISIFAIGLTFSFLVEMAFGFIFTLGICSLLCVNYINDQVTSSIKKGIPSSEDREINLKGKDVIVIHFPTVFINSDELKMTLSSHHSEGNVVIDLSNCNYIDVDCNLVLMQYCTDNKDVTIIGTPINLYQSQLLKLGVLISEN